MNHAVRLCSSQLSKSFNYRHVHNTPLLLYKKLGYIHKPYMQRAVSVSISGKNFELSSSNVFSSRRRLVVLLDPVAPGSHRPRSWSPYPSDDRPVVPLPLAGYLAPFGSY